MHEFSDAEQHERGSFLEYGGVEPARLAFLQRAVELGGAEALAFSPTQKTPENAAFQARCAVRLQALKGLRGELAKFADEPADREMLAPQLVRFDRIYTEAAQYIERPERLKDRRLGDLHLDLIWVLEAIQVISLRLCRRGASPVMPVQRWIGADTPLEIWQHARTGKHWTFFGCDESARSVRLLTRSVTFLLPAEIAPLLAIDWLAFHVDARALYQAAQVFNREQAAQGGSQLYIWWPEDSVELREYTERHAAMQAVYQQVMAALTKDLAELHAAGQAYVGWARSYDYE